MTPGRSPAGTVTMLFTEDRAALLSRQAGLPDTN
jgi:hypothetical protein